MSTEAADAADMAKKNAKHKKNKGYTDNNTKKRKREEREAEGVVEDPIEERASKKHKRDQKKTKSIHRAVQPRKSLLEQHSPFVKQTTSFYLALSPCAQAHALEGLCAKHLSHLILTFVPALKSILLSYENARMSEQLYGSAQAKSSEGGPAVLSQSIDEYAVTLLWLTADFTLFKPRTGTYLQGVVNVQNESMLGLVCYNYFNAVIDRDKLPRDWTWVEDDEEGLQKQKKPRRALQGAGHFEDSAGEEIEGKLMFRVDGFEVNAGPDGGPSTTSIMGTLRLDDDVT